MGIPNLGLLITVDLLHRMFRRTSDDCFKVQVIADAKLLHVPGSGEPWISVSSDLITKTLQVGLSA
jgi:hypothetical protein